MADDKKEDTRGWVARFLETVPEKYKSQTEPEFYTTEEHQALDYATECVSGNKPVRGARTLTVLKLAEKKTARRLAAEARGDE